MKMALYLFVIAQSTMRKITAKPRPIAGKPETTRMSAKYSFSLTSSRGPVC